jgi:CMP-N-acetylneuraminic acid synthetase
MYKKKKILCVVLARKNSKGITNKNLLKLNNKELFLYPLYASQKSKLLDMTILSSDSKKIIKIAKSKGFFAPFIRPKKYSRDKSTSFDAIKHSIEFLKSKKLTFDYILLLEPTSPLTSSEDIDHAIKKIISLRKQSAVSVAKLSKFNSNSIFKINKKNKELIIKKKIYYHKRRQEFNDEFILDGSLYISELNSLYLNKGFISRRTLGIKFKDELKNVEIDTIFDYKIIKKLSERNI